jgi:hypothetical protein
MIRMEIALVIPSTSTSPVRIVVRKLIRLKQFSEIPALATVPPLASRSTIAVAARSPSALPAVLAMILHLPTTLAAALNPRESPATVAEKTSAAVVATSVIVAISLKMIVDARNATDVTSLKMTAAARNAIVAISPKTIAVAKSVIGVRNLRTTAVVEMIPVIAIMITETTRKPPSPSTPTAEHQRRPESQGNKLIF